MELQEILLLKESENQIEFKAARNNFKYAGGKDHNPRDRRHCILGYVSAFCNEGGGKLVLGVTDNFPHSVVGSSFYDGSEGELQNKIYSDLGVRVKTHVFLENNKRVLLIEIPSRPLGKLIKFEGVPLMRVGQSLLEMSDEQIHKILSEREPDFSAKICEELTIHDLDSNAIAQMREKYSKKQKNPRFLMLSTIQVLSDLRLSNENNKLNYAALILLGKEEAIQKYLPQSKILWEFRFTESQIHYDFRQTVSEPLFLGIDKIWEFINDKNADIPIQNGAYISSSKSFNEEVIREAILNAIAHRDYTITSDVVIKQFPKRIIINNPGGFPKGVTIDNLLTVSSTPRSRLMSEVLEKTGLVERSGQGVDKIYSITLSEGKSEPDYKSSDLFQVTLNLEGIIKDKSFNIFINQVQKNRASDQKLSVEEIVTLYKVKSGLYLNAKQEILVNLERQDLIQKVQGTRRFSLADEYNEMSIKEQRIGSRYTWIEIEQFVVALQGNSLKIGALVGELSGSLNRNQIKYLIKKLFEDNIIMSQGAGKGTRYLLKKPYARLRGDALLSRISGFLRKKYE